jgi:DNA-binding protein H-NS
VGQSDLEQMDLDRLWELHVEVSELLKERIKQERRRLVDQLSYLRGPSHGHRPYPPVLPKYRNPDHPAETWAGRGKQPRWLTARLKSGKRIDDFKI